MDLEHLEKLVDLMNEHDLVEVEVETEAGKFRLKRAGSDAPIITQLAGVPAAGSSASESTTNPETSESEGSDVEGDSVTFNSPMVGTFYSASAPDVPLYVKVGDRVAATSVLCIIEAMKVMNEITADMEGEVLGVLVQNGEAVEYGQPLFTIRPGQG